MLLKHEVKAVLTFVSTASDKQLDEMIISLQANKMTIQDPDALQSADWIMLQVQLEKSARAEVKKLASKRIESL